MSATEALRQGPRVVDFSTHLSGPLASHLLVEAGAELIKVESPRGGDGNRGLDPLVPEVDLGVFHLALNGGARSIAVNARSEAWPRVVEACARWADAVIVGARPQDARKRGLDFASIRAYNPSTVYCALSGYGERGPWAANTAHGQTIDGFAGAVPVTSGEDGLPTTPKGWRSVGTTLGGVFAALGVLAGIYRRDHSGGGAQHIGVSLWASALWWQWRDTTSLSTMGELWHDYADFGSRYRMYETRDERAMLLVPAEQKFWERLCDLLGLPAEVRARGSWASTRMDFGAGPEYAGEVELIAAKMAERTQAEWLALFTEQEIPCGPTLSLEEVLASQHAEAEEAMREVSVRGHDLRVPASPVRLREGDDPPASELRPLSPPPELGEHSDEILIELGLEDLVGRLG